MGANGESATLLDVGLNHLSGPTSLMGANGDSATLPNLDLGLLCQNSRRHDWQACCNNLLAPSVQLYPSVERVCLLNRTVLMASLRVMAALAWHTLRAWLQHIGVSGIPTRMVAEPDMSLVL